MLIALPNAYGDAATNMAIDAAILEGLPKGLAVFRHYGWLEPAVTFGYGQSYESVAAITSAGLSSTASADFAVPLTLCRRLTGGGIVDHRDDWTYALILHPSLACAKTPATELYEHIHRAIGRALESLDIETQLAPCPKTCNSEMTRPRIPKDASQCFVTPAANDVLRSDGRKIAGAAMKRNRHGLLIQGSLDRAALPQDFDCVYFQRELLEQLASALSIPNGSLEDIRPLFNSERIEREKQRFESREWNHRR